MTMPDTPALAALREAERAALEALEEEMGALASDGFVAANVSSAWGGVRAALTAYRDAVEARVQAEQAEVLTFIQRNLHRFFGHREHWDPTMSSGLGCPLCIEQSHARAEIEERIRAALPPEGDHAE